MFDVIFGYLGHGNPGDDLLLLDALKRSNKKRIVVFLNGQVYPNIPSEIYRRKKVHYIINRYIQIFFILFCSDITCVGGTCFHGRKSGFFKFQLLAFMFFKKIDWINVGFESNFTTTKFKKFIFKRTVNNFIVRDAESVVIARKTFNVMPHLESDAVFRSDQKMFVTQNKYCTVSVRTNEGLTQIMNEYVDTLRGFDKVYLIKCVDDDEPILQALNLYLEGEGISVTIIDYGLLFIVPLIAKSALFVGERLHLQLIAELSKVPLSKIHYMEKTQKVIQIED